jgi:hypothetical protein
MAGNIFGGYNRTEWKNSPKFYGDVTSFLFTLSPEINVYRTTGINTNYMYLCHGSRTLVSGLGMGGQLEYFGLYVDDSFAGGHCRGDKSTTFGNPPLCGNEEEYEIDCVEVWIVKRKIVDEYFDEAKASVLDNAAASNFLEMAGHKMYSKDLERPEERK